MKTTRLFSPLLCTSTSVSSYHHKNSAVREVSFRLVISLLAFLFCLALISCQSSQQEVVMAAEPVTLPMEMAYKADFAIGNMSNVKTVVEWNKRLSDLNPDVSDLLHDTVSFNLADGTAFILLSRDSAISILKEYMNGVASHKINYITAFPVDNTLQKHEWVISHTDEAITYKDGKSEHDLFVETYLIVNGRIREVYQYKRPVLKPEEKPA